MTLVLASALTLIPFGERPASAQLGRAALGGTAGVGGGAVVTLSVVMARARFQREYLDSVEDLIHWQSTPMILAPAAGLLFGYASDDALRASVVGSTTGMLIGATTGALAGWVLADDRQAPWAYGLIGAGVGLATGGIVEGIRAWGEDENASLDFPKFMRFNIRVPVQ